MGLVCFLKSIDSIGNLGNDVYRVNCSVTIMDESSTVISATIDATRGTDWKIQTRDTIAQLVLDTTGQVMDLLVMPNLETI